MFVNKIRGQTWFNNLRFFHQLINAYLSLMQKVGESVLGDDVEDVDEKELSCLRVFFPFTWTSPVMHPSGIFSFF